MNSSRWAQAFLGFAVILWLSCSVVMVGGQDDDDDYHYESDGHLYFDDIDPEIPDYNNTGEYHGGTMHLLFQIVNAFIGGVNSATMTSYIMNVFETAVKQESFTFDMLYDGLALALISSAVYVFCIFIGILFLIVFPVGWVVIFCLRRCGRCGQKSDRRPPKKFFYIYGGIVFICLIFVLAFTICMSTLLRVYLTEYIPQVYFDPFDYLFNDLRAFVAYTSAEFEFLLGPEFSYLMDEVSALMADVPIDGGRAVYAAIETFIEDSADTFSDAQTTSIDYNDLLTAELSAIIAVAASLNSALGIVATDGATLGSECGDTDCQTIADDVDTHTGAWELIFDDLSSSNPMDSLSTPDIFVITWADTAEGIDNVTEKDVAEGITNVLDAYYLNDIGDIRAEVNLISANAESIIQDDVETEIDNLQAIVDPYLAEVEAQVDIYSTYKDIMFSVTLTAMFILFVIVAVGLILGIISYDPEEMPSERNTRSHVSGILLIIACVLSIVIVIIFMAVCVALFTFMMPMNTVCVELLSTEFLNKFDTADIFETGNNTGVYQSADDFLGEYIFGNDSSVYVSSYDILHSCQDNTASFQVTKMWLLDVYTDGVAVYDEAVSNYEDTVTAIQDGLVVKLDASNLWSDEFEDSLAFQSSDLDLTSVESFLDDYDAWVDVIQNGFSNSSDTYDSISTLSSAISVLSGSISDYQSDADDIATGLDSAESGDLATLVTALSNARTYISDLDASLADLVTAALDLNTTLNNLTVYLDDLALPIIKDSIIDELTTIEVYIDDYYQYFVYEVNNTIAGCKYVANIYWTLTHAVCSYTLNPLNSIWFLCGALAVFYAPISAFTLKLSNSLRRQEDLEEDFHYDVAREQVVYDIATNIQLRPIPPVGDSIYKTPAGKPPPPVHAAPAIAMVPIVYRKPNGPPVLLPRIEVRPRAEVAGQQNRSVELRDAAFIRKE